MVPGGGSSMGTKQKRTDIEEKLYNMIYQRYVKGKGKFITHNALGVPIVQDVKYCGENRENIYI